MIIARRILFFIFLVLYLALCPLLILYSFGYIFNPVKQEMDRTGLIYLSSMPEGADIYLGRSRYKQKTPAGIEALTPGNYKITLRLKGRKPWSRSVYVDSGKASSFKNILLIPKTFPVKNILAGPFVKLTAGHEADYLLIAGSADLDSYLVYDCRRGEAAPLLPEDSLFSGMPVVSIFTEESSPVFVIYGGSLWNRRYLYVNLAETPAEIVDISALISERPVDIVWNDSDRYRIFALYRDSLDIVNVRTGALFPGYIEGIKGCGISHKWLYILDEKNNVLRQAYDKDREELVYSWRWDSGEVFKMSGFYRIRALENGAILFLGQRGRLLINKPPYSLVERGVIGLEFYKKNQDILLYWTKNSIGILDFSLGLAQRVVNDSGTNITDCFFVNEGRYALFNDNNVLRLIEVFPGGTDDAEQVVEIKNNTSFFYSEDTGKAYYIDPRDSGLKSVTIVPR